jgi:hypothetical protein
MLSDLSIRFVAREDHGRWLPLWEGYNRFYGRSGTTALSAAITRMTWARFFDAYEPVHALVAESGDQLLGLAHYILRLDALVSTQAARTPALDELRARPLTIGSRSLPSAIAEARTSSSVTTAGRPERACAVRPGGRRARVVGASLRRRRVP